jgi:pimeloyl-ACP methyl ester carboxylesterase
MLRHFVEGRGPPVLFLHGFGLDARMWRPQVAALRASHCVITVDLPDFGPSPVSVGTQTAAGALVELLDAVTSGAVHVVGLSLGGAVAVDLALAFPTHVRSLTLIDTPLLGRRTGIGAWLDAAALAKAGNLDEAREAWLNDPLFACARVQPQVLASVREMTADYSGDHWRGIATTRFEVADPFPRLREIKVATMVLVGEHDLPSFHAEAEVYACEIPRAIRDVVAGAGHLANLEAADIVNAHLARFLASA